MTGQTGDEAGPAAPDAVPLDFRVLSGDPTPAELAAVTAVLLTATETARASGRRADEHVRSAWQRAQRPVREPLLRGAGTWRSFSG